MQNSNLSENTPSILSSWDVVIGIEVHVQLNTKSKIFSPSSTCFGEIPNSQVDITTLGMPGSLPVLNQEAVKKAIQFGLAINATINSPSLFERKNYFYPDLPKGYQISQYQTPIISQGTLPIFLSDHQIKIINITRAHLEEDAGKSVHGLESFTHQAHSGIDLNRAGMPLLEVVTEPEFNHPDEAVSYLKSLHELVCTLGICEGNLQEGNFRADLNISLKPKNTQTLGTRVEIKNINSFNFAKLALDYEIQRQSEALENGQIIFQETRLFDPEKSCTRPMRSKENAQDYRYFPDPDLPPLYLNKTWIEEIKKNLPELPQAKRLRYERYGFSHEDIDYLINSNQRMINLHFEKIISENLVNPKLTLNFLRWPEYLDILNININSNINFDLLIIFVRELLIKLDAGKLSQTAARQVFQSFIKNKILNSETVLETQKVKAELNQYIHTLGLEQVSDQNQLEQWVDQVILNHPAQMAELKTGKIKLLGYLVGQALKLSGGKANPGELKAIFERKMSS